METQNKLYFLSKKGERQGPYTYEELEKLSLTANTLVWSEGSGWKNLDEIEELRPLLDSSFDKEEINKESSSSSSFPMPVKTWFVESILIIVFCCLPFGIVALVHAIKVQSMNEQGKTDLAQFYSKKTKQWVSIGFVVGLIVFILSMLFYFITFFVYGLNRL